MQSEIALFWFRKSTLIGRKYKEPNCGEICNLLWLKIKTKRECLEQINIFRSLRGSTALNTLTKGETRGKKLGRLLLQSTRYDMMRVWTRVTVGIK